MLHLLKKYFIEYLIFSALRNENEKMKMKMKMKDKDIKIKKFKLIPNIVRFRMLC